MDFGKSVILLVSLVLFSIWMGMIWKAEGEDRLAEICHPIELVTGSITRVTTGLVGHTPNWTVRVEGAAMKHCYFLAASLLKEQIEEEKAAVNR